MKRSCRQAWAAPLVITRHDGEVPPPWCPALTAPCLAASASPPLLLGPHSPHSGRTSASASPQSPAAACCTAALAVTGGVELGGKGPCCACEATDNKVVHCWSPGTVAPSVQQQRCCRGIFGEAARRQLPLPTRLQPGAISPPWPAPTRGTADTLCSRAARSRLWPHNAIQPVF